MSKHLPDGSATSAAVGAVVLAAIAYTGCAISGTDPAAARDTQPAADALAALPVTAEDTAARDAYDRDDWPHWSTGPGGCDTRQRLLIERGRDVTTGKDCKVLAGNWTDAYTQTTVTEPSSIELDHVVALAEAAESGAGTWTEDQRETYANDPDLLVLAADRTNAAKRDHDATDWQPARPCTYARLVIDTKTRYSLAVDQAEHDALADALTTCPKGDPDSPTPTP